jgi:outer membrane protein
MKRSLVLFLTLASGFALSAAAQTPSTPAPAGPVKIAVIAFQAAVGQTNEFQRNLADMQKKFDPKRQQLKAASDEIESLQKDLQAQGDKLSDAEHASRARTIDEKQKQAKRAMEDAKNDYQQEMQDTFSAVATKVADVMIDYVKQQGYTLVLDASQQQQAAPLVLYASESTNITKAVIDAYNVKSGVPAPASPPAGLAPKPAPKATPAAH